MRKSQIVPACIFAAIDFAVVTQYIGRFIFTFLHEFSLPARHYANAVAQGWANFSTEGHIENFIAVGGPHIYFVCLNYNFQRTKI